jgi:hypothetical protein
MDTNTRNNLPEMVDLSALEQDRDYQPTGRQRSARTDPSMRDGDSGHGNPYEYAPVDDEPTTDNDVGDEVDEGDDELLASVGAADGTPAVPADLTTRPPPPTVSDALPIPGYPNLSVPEIIGRFGTMSREQLERVVEYESRHRKRKTLLTKLTRVLRTPSM